MEFSPKNIKPEKGSYAPDSFQRLALAGMLVLTILTFVGANLHAVLWRTSDRLVSTVLPAVIVKLTNEERADLAEAPLRRSVVLDEAARMKAEHMAKNQYFAHYAPDGTSPWYWFTQAGYTYAHAGENLAIHFTDSSEVVEAWMNSPKHRENIVNTNFTEIGVGTAKGTFEGYDTVYVVQLFGAPAAAPVVKTTPTPAPKPVPKETLPPAPANTPSNDEAVLANADEGTPPTEVTAREEDAPVVTTPANEAATNNEATRVTTDESGAVTVEKEMISTSSGLAVATVTETPEEAAQTEGLATRPNKLLEIVYIMFGIIVVGLLVASVVVEARKTRYVQAAYGVGLLIIMVALWYVNALLTTGATVI